MNEGAVTTLLIDDDTVDAMAVRRAFKELRITNPLVVARDGFEALDLLRGANGREKVPRPYLIMLDLNMPRMSGIEFLEVLRQDPGLQTSVVFVLTTSDDEQDRIRAYAKGIAGYVLKSQVGRSFIAAIAMIEHYWKVVEMPLS